MSSPSLEQLKDELLSCLDEDKNVIDMTRILDVITKLQTVPVNREILEATRLGLLVNEVRRKNQDSHPQIGKLCRGLIKDWQKLISNSAAPSSGSGKPGVSPGLERLTTPSGRTTTPHQTATARLIAESGLRCSPSPASIQRVQPTTPSMVNGVGARAGTSSTGISPESTRSSQKGVVSSSYAPPEQQVSNGPGLKIRIKYGGVDQQPSIVREIEAPSPTLPETVQVMDEAGTSDQGAEEASNRRKRKVPPDQVARATGLVNGSSKSVSPCTPVPSPAVTTVSSETTALMVPTVKQSKKSKSSSPDSGSTPVASVSNILQRPKLKSTAELVAEMTSSYPETMSISLKNVVPTPASPPVGTAVVGRSASTAVMASVLANEAQASDNDFDDDSKDEDYHEPGMSGKKSSKSLWTSTIVGDRKSEMFDRYRRDASLGDGKLPKAAARIKGKKETTEDQPQVRIPVRVRSPIDWYAAVQLPPVDFSVFDGLVVEEEEEEEETQVAVEEKVAATDVTDDSTGGKFLDVGAIEADADPTGSSNGAESCSGGTKWRSRLLKAAERGDRQVLAMPYVDIGLPDFLEYGYANRQQYLAHWSER